MNLAQPTYIIYTEPAAIAHVMHVVTECFLTALADKFAV